MLNVKGGTKSGRKKKKKIKREAHSSISDAFKYKVCVSGRLHKAHLL